MTIWKVCKFYRENDPVYEVLPFDWKGHLSCVFKWYGFKGLRWCYFSKKQAENKTKKLRMKERI